MAFFPNSWIIDSDTPKSPNASNAIPRAATPQRHPERTSVNAPLGRRGSFLHLHDCINGAQCGGSWPACCHDDVYPHELLRESGMVYSRRDDSHIEAPLPVPPKSHPRVPPPATAATDTVRCSAIALTPTATARQQRPRDRYPSQFPTSWLLDTGIPQSCATPRIVSYRALTPTAAPSPQVSLASIPTTAASLLSPPTPNPVVTASQPILATGGDLPIRALNFLQGGGAEQEREAEEQQVDFEEIPQTTLAALDNLREPASTQGKAVDMIEMWVESQSVNHKMESISGSILALARSSPRMSAAANHPDKQAPRLALGADEDTAMADDSDETDDSGLGDAPHVAQDPGDDYSVYSDWSD